VRSLVLLVSTNPWPTLDPIAWWHDRIMGVCRLLLPARCPLECSLFQPQRTHCRGKTRQSERNRHQEQSLRQETDCPCLSGPENHLVVRLHCSCVCYFIILSTYDVKAYISTILTTESRAIPNAVVSAFSTVIIRDMVRHSAQKSHDFLIC